MMTAPRPESHVNHNACLWEPRAREISLALVPETANIAAVFPFGHFWYLQLAGSLSVGLGRHPESVASDAAAMRKLAAVAAEVAGELERRAAEIRHAGSASDDATLLPQTLQRPASATSNMGGMKESGGDEHG